MLRCLRIPYGTYHDTNDQLLLLRQLPAGNNSYRFKFHIRFIVSKSVSTINFLIFLISWIPSARNHSCLAETFFTDFFTGGMVTDFLLRLLRGHDLYLGDGAHYRLNLLPPAGTRRWWWASRGRSGRWWQTSSWGNWSQTSWRKCPSSTGTGLGDGPHYGLDLLHAVLLLGLGDDGKLVNNLVYHSFFFVL